VQPGVKEQLQEEETNSTIKRTKFKIDGLRERLDADYFGFHDTEDGDDNRRLEQLEAKAEAKCKLTL
jgi:hypothetical protein